MARAVLVLDRRIIFRALVDVVDHQHDRGAGGDLSAACFAHEHAGHDLDRVRLLPLRGEARLAGPAAVEMVLDLGRSERNPRRSAVDHAADRRPMALAEGRDPEKVAEGIERHGIPPGSRVS